MTGTLASKRVLLIGAGGLGTPIARVLAQSGVGLIEVMDDDVVELSNLHRQLLYCENDLGKSKALLACACIERDALAANVGGTRAVAREMRLDPDNALEAVGSFDLVIEGADNFSTKFLVADACALAHVPCVQGGAVRWTGWVLGSLPGQSACLRCVFEDLPEGPAQGCAEAGVIGPVVGVVGALQAALALRILRGDSAAAGVLHHYRALTGVVRSRALVRSASCPSCTGRISDLNATRYVPRECAA